MNLDKLKEEEEKSAFEPEESRFFNIENGPNEVRLLPMNTLYLRDPDAVEDFAVEFPVHEYLFDVTGFKKIRCRKNEGRCPICERLQNKPKANYGYNVLDLADGKVKVMTSGKEIRTQLRRIILDKNWGDIYAITAGRNVIIERIPKEKTNTGWVQYSVRGIPQVKDITTLLPKGWEDTIDCLATTGLPHMFTEEELEKLVEIYKVKGDPRDIFPEKEQGTFEKGTSRPVSTERKPATGAIAPKIGEEEKKKEVAPAKEVTKSDDVEKIPEDCAECYGEDFSFKLAKCKSCLVRIQCKRICFAGLKE